MIAAPAAREPGRVGYVIGRKAMPLAVDRNRLRRRMRETVRMFRPAIERFDVIFRVRNRVARADIASAVAESSRLLAKVVGAAA